MYTSIIALAALCSTALASTATTCKYPEQTSMAAPPSSTKCQHGVQTFALQAVGNCSDPYNGYFVQFLNETSEGLDATSFQLRGTGDIAQFYFHDSKVLPVSSTTPDPSTYGSKTPVAVVYELTGQGSESPAGPLMLHQPSSQYKYIPCSNSTGFLACSAPNDGAHVFVASDLDGPHEVGTIYLVNGVVPPNRNNGNTDAEYITQLQIVDTCQL